MFRNNSTKVQKLLHNASSLNQHSEQFENKSVPLNNPVADKSPTPPLPATQETTSGVLSKAPATKPSLKRRNSRLVKIAAQQKEIEEIVALNVQATIPTKDADLATADALAEKLESHRTTFDRAMTTNKKQSTSKAQEAKQTKTMETSPYTPLLNQKKQTQAKAPWYSYFCCCNTQTKDQSYPEAESSETTKALLT